VSIGVSVEPVIEQLSVVEGYERWAPIYDQTPNPVLALERRQIDPLIPNLDGKRVLDLACGTGRWLNDLAKRAAAQVIGLDISSTMLRAASQNKVATRRLLQADCLQIPLANDSIYFAMCSFAIGHMANLAQFASECARVMQSNATFLVTDLHPTAYMNGWRTGFRDRRGAAEIENIMRNQDEIVRTFGSAGFASTGTEGFYFGEAERPIFASAGKEAFFAEACRNAAILFCAFSRR
jgi:ubiquinone/menaquinone biosynthesis C-methylase UbiE